MNVIRARVLAFALLALPAAGCTTETPEAPRAPEPLEGRAGPSATGEDLRLSRPRAVHRATLLVDGRVLVTGGCTEPGCGGFEAGRTAEVYADGRFEPGAAMGSARASGSAARLRDGRVLLVGGYPGEGRPPTAAAELYDPATGTFAAVGALAAPRADHTASLLPDGRVLVAGGFDAAGRARSGTEVFDPATARFTRGPDLGAPRAAHVAVTVGDRVVLLGGTGQTRALATTEVYVDGAWQAGPSLRTPRVRLGAAPIGAGRVLVVGGATDTEGRRRLDTTELIDLSSGRVEPGPRLTQGEYKLDGAVAVLADGRVVVPSGDGLDVFDPDTGTMGRLPGTTYTAGSFRTVTALGGADVLVVGGYDDAIRPTDRAVLVRVPRPLPG